MLGKKIPPRNWGDFLIKLGVVTVALFSRCSIPEKTIMRNQTILYLSLICSVLSSGCFAQPGNVEFSDLRRLSSACSENPDNDKLMGRLEMLLTGVYEWDGVPEVEQWRDTARQELSCIYEQGIDVELLEKHRKNFAYTAGSLLYLLYGNDSLEQACELLRIAQQEGAVIAGWMDPYFDKCDKKFPVEEPEPEYEPEPEPVKSDNKNSESLPWCSEYLIDSLYTGTCQLYDEIHDYVNGKIVRTVRYKTDELKTKRIEWQWPQNGKWDYIAKSWDENGKKNVTKHSRKGYWIVNANNLFKRKKYTDEEWYQRMIYD